eukprot:gene7123-2669_t
MYRTVLGDPKAKAEKEGSSKFDQFITVLILLNMVALAMHHYNIDPKWEMANSILNMIFTGAFTIELIMKLLAMGWVEYVASNWNKFDFIIVVMSYVGIAANLGGGIASAVRVFRVGRALRLLNKAKGLQTLFNAMIQALPSLFNIALLLLATFFMFGVLAVALFGKLK